MAFSFRPCTSCGLRMVFEHQVVMDGQVTVLRHCVLCDRRRCEKESCRQPVAPNAETHCGRRLDDYERDDYLMSPAAWHTEPSDPVFDAFETFLQRSA